jgi:hypothetical protein
MTQKTGPNFGLVPIQVSGFRGFLVEFGLQIAILLKRPLEGVFYKFQKKN